MTKRRKGPKRRKRALTSEHPTKVSDEDRAKFLLLLQETRNVSFSAYQCGFTRAAAYLWRSEDEAFRRAWDEAVEVPVDKVEQEVFRTALEGYWEEVWEPDPDTGELALRRKVLKRHPNMSQWILERARPELWRQRTDPQTVVGVNQSNTVEVGPKYQTFEAEPDDEYLARLVGIVDDIRERRLAAETKKVQ